MIARNIQSCDAENFMMHRSESDPAPDFPKMLRDRLQARLGRPSGLRQHNLEVRRPNQAAAASRFAFALSIRRFRVRASRLSLVLDVFSR